VVREQPVSYLKNWGLLYGNLSQCIADLASLEPRSLPCLGHLIIGQSRSFGGQVYTALQSCLNELDNLLWRHHDTEPPGLPQFISKPIAFDRPAIFLAAFGADVKG